METVGIKDLLRPCWCIRSLCKGHRYQQSFLYSSAYQNKMKSIKFGEIHEPSKLVLSLPKGFGGIYYFHKKPRGNGEEENVSIAFVRIDLGWKMDSQIRP